MLGKKGRGLAAHFLTVAAGAGKIWTRAAGQSCILFLERGNFDIENRYQ
jgi:hypothetical protein